MKKTLSFILALATVIGCFAVTTVPTAAATNSSDNINYEDVLYAAYDHEYLSAADYVNDQVELGYMKLMARSGGYELYCNKYTGEMAYVNVASGQVLTSNPYNFTVLKETFSGDKNPSKSDTYTNLLSQLEVAFVDNESKVRTFTSFVEAAARGQITVKPMRNGFRVEYTMGRLNTTYLLPGVVLEEDFNNYVIEPFEETLKTLQKEADYETYETACDALERLRTWYQSANINDTVQNSYYKTLAEKYPAFKEGKTVCYLDEESGDGMQDKERVDLENYLKEYCPDLDYELLDAMHAQTGYRPDINETPVFRAALEYILEKDGLSVRLPASSIRFDESKYTLKYVKVLQFFGAGNLKNDGYVFYPDGSGALVEFNEFYSETNKEAFTISASVYGEDFAYYDIDENAKHSEIIRVPVFGMVEEEKSPNGKKETGFFAILEQGGALADIATYFGGGEYNYATVYPMVYPRPSDAYNLSEAISVAENKEMTIVSDKKYTGFYNLKYKMLFDDDNLTVAEKETDTRYHASYSGMANAYRAYLSAKKTITPLTEAEVQNGKLPLYIETLGAVETVDKILSIPVNVDVPLASFEDIQTMYTQLAKKNITNINFKLTGYANGGLNANYPKKVKWLKAVGGKRGFEDLQAFALENGIGIYPEFEFTYAGYDSGVRLKKHAARAVDDRYCSKQLYDPVYQEFDSHFNICISPSSILELVTEFSESYSKFSPTGISVGSLGGELNSDFNKDNSLNRQDAQEYIEESLGHLNETYHSVMAEGGNIYSIEYLDHVLNMPLDSSKYKYESKSVPFLGMVLHGYVNYAGSVINEAGDSRQQLLKSIENGALLYYMLIYQNASLLKEDKEFSKFYSVRFDIWFDTIVDQYNLLNGAIGDLQLYNLVEHDFLTGERLQKEHEIATEIADANKRIEIDLTNKYNLELSLLRNRIRVKQTAQNLILAGYTDPVALKARMEYVLGKTLTVDDEAIVAERLAADPSTFEDYYGKQFTVAIDRAALEAQLLTIFGEAATEEQKAYITAFENAYCTPGATVETADIALKEFSGLVKPKDNSTPSYAQDDDYVKTDYTDASGRIVMVTYAMGDSKVHFVLNYNTYDVKVRLSGINNNEYFSVPAYGFARINGTVLAN